MKQRNECIESVTWRIDFQNKDTIAVKTLTVGIF